MEDNEVKVPISSRPVRKTAPLYQFRALFAKNGKLLIRNKVVLCCMCCLPMFLMISVGALNILFIFLFDRSDAATSSAEVVIDTPRTSFASEFDYQFAEKYSWYVNLDPTGESLGQIPIETCSGPTSQTLANFSLGSYALFDFAPRSCNQVNGPGSDRTYPSDYMILENTILQKSSQAEVDKEILAFRRYYNRLSQSEADNFQPSLDRSLPLNVLLVKSSKYLNRTVDLEVTIMTDAEPQRVTKSTAISYTIERFLSAFALSRGMASTFWTRFSLISPYFRDLPDWEQPLSLDVSSLILQYILPIAFSFFTMVITYDLVYDKQEKLREMMKTMGLSMTQYWVLTFSVNFIVYIISWLAVVIVGAAFQLRWFLQTNFGLNIALFVGWGFIQMGFSFTLSTLFSKSRTAMIITFILVLVNVIAGYLINLIPSIPKTHPGFKIWPPFAFYRGIFAISELCGSLNCPQEANEDLRDVFLALWIGAPLWLLLAIYLDQVLPQQYGIRKHPLFFLDPIVKRIWKPKSTLEELLFFVHSVDENEDHDVAEERTQVESGNLDPAQFPIIIHQLAKTYTDSFGRPQKLALRNLSLSMKQGECFGLLGPNGAGKTTTISILTGLYAPSGGSAKICGFDINQEMDEVHKIMGICPQFDTLWERLTVRETLLFYTRLKGTFGVDANRYVAESIASVGLTDASHKKVHQLSGGMKRRLSVAVALVGDPAVIFLDEPTTGLDPVNRRSLWDVLLRVKKGRCIILTTHSMEEADILCDRIGIMSMGSLQCLGPNNYLKTKFGEGYTLKINFKPADSSTVEEWIKTTFPKHEIQEKFPGNITYRLPKETLISYLFDKLNNDKQNSKIQDWGVNQTSLEDVFLSIAKRDQSLAL